MKLIDKITSLLLGVIFLATSTGIVIYQSHCSCTGNDQVSIYVMPECCGSEHDNNLHNQHSHNPDKQGCDSDGCDISLGDFGCNTVQMKYVKLEGQVLQAKTNNPIIQYNLVGHETQLSRFLFSLKNEPEKLPKKYDPSPPKVIKATDYLVFIQQLKIPYSA